MPNPMRGGGPRQIYGAKLDYRTLPLAAIQTTTVLGSVTTRIFKPRYATRNFRSP